MHMKIIFPIFPKNFLLCYLLFLPYFAYGGTNDSSPTSLPENATGKTKSGDDIYGGVSLGEILLEDYPKYIRPVYETNTTTIVRHSLALIHIHDMDERNQILTLIGWVREYWQDQFLVWDPKKYNGVEQIRLPFSVIWQPDIVLYNSGSQVFYLNFDTEAVVSYNGQIGAFKPFMMSSTCKIDATNFPFDLQACELKFGSWSYHEGLIDIVSENETAADIDNFNPNGEWDLLDMKVQHNSVKYACCEEHYSDLTYTITLKRRWLFYMVSLILPCIMISILIILGYCLPPESGEKVTVSVTAILSLMVFLVLVLDQMPPTSDYIPLIQIYFVGTIAINTFSCVMTALVLNIHHRRPHSKPVPNWLHSFAFNFLAPILRMKRSDDPSGLVKKHRKTSLVDTGKDSPSAEMPTGANDIMEQLNRQREATTGYIEFVVDSRAETEHKKNCTQEWKEIARIIDRLLFVFFTILVFLFTSSILIYNYIHSKVYTM